MTSKLITLALWLVGVCMLLFFQFAVPLTLDNAQWHPFGHLVAGLFLGVGFCRTFFGAAEQ